MNKEIINRKKLKNFKFDYELNFKNTQNRFVKSCGSCNYHIVNLIYNNKISNCKDAHDIMLEKTIDEIREKLKKSVKLKMDEEKLNISCPTSEIFTMADDSRRTTNNVYLIECENNLNVIYDNEILDSFTLDFTFKVDNYRYIFYASEMSFMQYNNRRYTYRKNHYQQYGTSRIIKAHNLFAKNIDNVLREKRKEIIKNNKAKKDKEDKLKLVKKTQKYENNTENFIVF